MYIAQGGVKVGKVGLQLWVCEFVLILLFIDFCINFHTNICEPTFAPPYIILLIILQC